MPSACKTRQASSAAGHTTECALEPDCVATGFGLVGEEQFFSFDLAGNKLALEYFKNTTRTKQHWVEVVGDLQGSLIRVREIRSADPPSGR